MLSVTPINTPSNSQNFVCADGNWELRNIAMKASTAMTDGYAIAYEVSASNPTGYATLAATTQANGQNIIGILAEKISSTDSDYATAGKLKKVWVPTSKRAQAFFKVTGGTFTAADVGRVCALTSGAAGLDVDTNGAGAQITGYISSTQGRCTFDVPLTTTA